MLCQRYHALEQGSDRFLAVDLMVLVFRSTQVAAPEARSNY